MMNISIAVIFGRIRDHARHVAHAHVAIDEHRDEERIGGGHGRGLRRREDAAVDAAQDDHDEEQSPRPPRGPRLQHRAPIGARLARQIEPPREDRNGHHEHARQHQPGHHARDEEIADRGLRSDAPYTTMTMDFGFPTGKGWKFLS